MYKELMNLLNEHRRVRFYTRDKNRVMWFLTDNGWEHSFCVRSVQLKGK